MKAVRRSRLWFAAVIIIVLVNIACLDQRTEEIVVAEDGSTTITARIQGDAENLRPPIALPSQPLWTILKHDIDSSEVPTGQLDFEAEIEVPYGTPLPVTYAGEDSEHHELNLRFPTEVRRWTEGNRTYYEFRRTYPARDYGCYNISGSDFWDSELEAEILENGIFNVSDEDRENYLDNFAFAFGYLQWRFLWTSLGTMYRGGEITLAAGDTIETRAAEYLEQKVTSTRILGILGKEDDSIGVALDRFKNEIHSDFSNLFSSVVGPDTMLTRSFADHFRRVTLNYEITEALNNNNFSVEVTLPGRVIESNGLVLPDDPEKVEWTFGGEALNDRAVPLFAISVVEH